MILILNHIKARLAQRKNFMGIACGEPGSGKSYAVISLAKAIDPTFTADRIAFTPEEFMDIVGNEKLKSGSAVIFEEVGVGIPAREWYSISNKMVNYVFQTFRFRQLVCFFNTPSMSYIDSNTRVLFNAYIEPVHIDFNREVCTVKYMEMQHNPRDEKRKIYFHYLTNSSDPVKRVEIPKPHEQLLSKYENKKKAFASTLLGTAQMELKGLREGRVFDGDKPNVRCPQCGHSWSSRAKTMWLLCSHCHKKFKRVYNQIPEDNTT